MPSPMYTLGGNFMKSFTTSNLISGASIDLGFSDTAPRPPPRPAGGVWAPPGGAWLPAGGVWAPPAGVCANKVMPVAIASATATPYMQCVFIGHLSNGAKCSTGSGPPHFRRGLEQQVRRGRAGVLVSDAAFSQITAAALARLHGNRCLHAGFGCGRALFQNLRQAASSLERSSHRIHRRKPGVHHRLVAERGLAALLQAFDAGLEQRDHVGGRELGLVCARRCGPKKKRPEEGPRAAAHGLDEDSRNALKDSADISRRFGSQFGLHRREAAVQTDSKIAVADG